MEPGSRFDHMSNADFASDDSFRHVPEDAQKAFVGKVTHVRLQAGFRLFKLTEQGLPPGGGLSPWWSSHGPYRDDTEGAAGRFAQARLNGVDMALMVRFMAAVAVEWNQLTQYLEIKLAVDCNAFWGRFALQPLFVQPGQDKANPVHARNLDVRNLPDQLGVLEAWQFYIPKLLVSMVTQEALLPAHDINILAQHLRVAPHA